jgi:uncharacterized protein
MWRVASPARLGVALVGTLAVLAVWNVLARPVLPSDYHVEGGLLVAGLIGMLGLWAGLAADELGLAPGRLLAGLEYGAAAFGVVISVVLVGLALPATHGSFHTARADVTSRQLLLELLVTIPIGTVVVEEFAFRGVLLALLRRVLPTTRAVLVCSAFFGLWHVDGIVRGATAPLSHVVAAAVGTFLATFAAGVVFCWLRLRSGSLLAPALAHLATNTVALVVAWLVVH